MMVKQTSKSKSWYLQYLSSVLVIWLAIAFYRFNPYYAQFLTYETQNLLIWLAFSYTLIAPFVYSFMPKKWLSDSKAYISLSMLTRLFKEFGIYLKTFPVKPGIGLPKISETERVATFFLIVKLFFLPLMINFLFTNYHSTQSGLEAVKAANGLLTISSFNGLIFPFLFSALFLIDTAFFVFGYTVESRFLRNRVRSVDPTYFGWIVALISYPPFNGIMGNYVHWYANDYVDFSSPRITALMHLLSLLLIGIYASASVALGPKASNLTNRGIVGYGPYRYIRHPAYISKNLAWWITIIPVLSVGAVMSMAVWSIVYFLRAITEERHLIRDPDYQAYCKKVRYRFIPGVV